MSKRFFGTEYLSWIDYLESTWHRDDNQTNKYWGMNGSLTKWWYVSMDRGQR
jgi:hypothetical protein